MTYATASDTARPSFAAGVSNPDLAALVLRVSTGVLFLAHAGLKLFVFTPAGTAGFFESLGVPGPLAYLVIAAELLGGIALTLGVWTRWVSLALLPVLLGSIYAPHGAAGFFFSNEGGGWEFPAFWAVALVVQALLGDGAYPANLRVAIDALNARIYPRLNNGVYRTGFATTQVAYEEAFADVFAMLDELEQRFADGRDFLFGDELTEADIRLFVTLVRFDPAYYGLFRANLRRLADYPRLSAYLERTLAVPGGRETVNLDHIKRGYYSIKALNPTGIVPTGPKLAWAA
jgi:uncharacterized membrane protein YphA (DoxX/SURF4 family)